MHIIVGLGNPGDKYENTRHNMGFKTVDKIADRYLIEIKKNKFKGLMGEGYINGEKVILFKPQTYMNLSGEAVSEIVSFYKISLSDLIVIYDDIDIPLGTIRIRKNGGPGTHNGMRSVVSCLGSREFPRIRIGIGQREKTHSLVNYVIGIVPEKERKTLASVTKKATEAASDILEHGIEKAMNLNNTRKSTEDNEN